MGPLLSPLLVGRDDLLALADRRIEEAAAGRGQVVLLAGEAGIGKTRLLRAVLRKADAAGFRIAQADLAPQDRLVPLASTTDLARTMREVPAFGSLGDDLLSMQGGQGGDSLGSRRILVRDLAERIANAIDRPTVLAFEDLQWADEMSLEVIGEIARLVADRPALVIGAYRADEMPLDTNHREWRARLLSQRRAEEARLAPLSYEETALVTSLILATGLPAPREVVSAVYERTDGIPLHIEELLGALGDDARSDGKAIRNAHVPSTIEDAIMARFGRLSEDARAVARAGAVVGRCFVPDVLAGIMDRKVADLDDALDELVGSSFLYTFSWVDQGYFDFRHQLLRDALYETVPVRELRRLHARAAEFGTRLIGATEIHQSVHFERAGLRTQAYRTAREGAIAASAMSSRHEAFVLYGRAVANAPEDLPPAELGELYEAYLEAAFAVDDVPAIEHGATRARECFLEAGRLVDAAGALVHLAGMSRRDVRPVEERQRLLAQAEAELLALPQSPERAMVAVRRPGDAGAHRDRRRQAGARPRRASTRPRAPAAVDRPRRRTTSSSWPRRRTSSKGAWSRASPRCSASPTTLGDARKESTGVTAFRWAAHMAVRVMDYPTAQVGIGEGLKYADEIEQSYCRHVLAATSAHVAWTEGRWNDAIPIAEIELVERGSRRGTLGSRDALGYVAFGRGQVERARMLLEASLEIGRSSGEVSLVLPPMWGLAETALVAREPQVAIEWCEAALEVAVSTGERALLVPFVVTGVRACQAAVRPDAAEAWLGRVRQQLDWLGPRGHGPGARRGPAAPAGRLDRVGARAPRGGDPRLGRPRADLGGDVGAAGPRRVPHPEQPARGRPPGPAGGPGDRRPAGEPAAAGPVRRAEQPRAAPRGHRRAVAPAHDARVRGGPARGGGDDQRGDRRGAGTVAQDRQRPPRAHPGQARRHAPGRGRHLGLDDPGAGGVRSGLRGRELAPLTRSGGARKRRVAP